ncbi:hypothetical protein Tco_1415928, partial [Tanacetum coccineum]
MRALRLHHLKLYMGENVDRQFAGVRLEIATVGLFRCFYVNSKKNGWMSFSKRSDNAPVCYTKPLDSLKNWNDHFFWVDSFACPASFPWHTAKNVTKDPAPVAADFNAQDYATLVAHPSSFRKFLEAFMCLVGLSRYYPLDEETYPRFLHKNGKEMDIFAFIHTPDPTKVKIVEREQNEDEPLLLATTIGRTVPLLSVAPDRAKSELEASVDRLFDKSGSGNQAKQGDFAGVGEGANIQPVVVVVAPVQPRCQGKRKYVRLFAGAVLNAEVRVTAIPTLPFVTVSVSSMPEREAGDHTDSVAEPNLRTIGASQRFVISSDSSHHSGPTIAEAEVDSLARSSVPIMMTVTTVALTVDPTLDAKEKSVKPSLFSTDSSLGGGANPHTGVFSDVTGSYFLVGGICTVIDPNTDLQKVYVPQWSVTNGSRLDDVHVYARQMCLSVKVRMRAEYNVKERRRLKCAVEEQGELLKARDREIEDLKAQLLLREAEAAKAIRLRAEASNFETVEKSLRDETNAIKERNVILEKERNALDVKVSELETSVAGNERELIDLNALVTFVRSQNDNLVNQLETSSSGLQEKVTVYENCMDRLEKFQDDRMKVVSDKFDKLHTDFVEMALHLEEKFYPHLLTTISGRRWLLTQGMELTVIKCLNLPEYFSALGAAIGKAIEKGMQYGLSAGITHGREGRVLTDVAAHNPSEEVDYIAALQRLQNVNFPLLRELKSSKDASIKAVMNILRLEESLTDKLGLEELQPNVDQLMVPIYHSSVKVVIGATALSLALDVSSIRVRKIKENIANQISVLHDVFVSLSEPFSAAILTGTDGTFNVMPATADTTTALSIRMAMGRGLSGIVFTIP